MATYGDDLQSFLSWLSYESAPVGKHILHPNQQPFEMPANQDPTVANQILGQVAQNWMHANPHGAADFLPPVEIFDAVSSLLSSPDLNSWMQQQQSLAAKDKAAKAAQGKGEGATATTMSNQAPVSVGRRGPCLHQRGRVFPQPARYRDGSAVPPRTASASLPSWAKSWPRCRPVGSVLG